MSDLQLISSVSIDHEAAKMIRTFFESNSRKMWTTIPAGLGHVFYAKHDGTLPNQPIHAFLMHSDMWGQYGEETSHVPKLVEFIPRDYCCGENCADAEQFITDMRVRYTKPSETKCGTIICPTCRVENNFDSSNYIKTRFQTRSGENCPKCIICQTNDIELTFNKCGHCVLCIECAKRWGK